MGLEAMRAWKSVPRCGLEIGGLLLGSCQVNEGWTDIYIEDFASLDSEHRSGPSFLLSEKDHAGLNELLARHPNTVGVFRSQTRNERLYLHVDDVDFFDKCITRTQKVFLLIEPRSGRAAYFLPENGALARAHTFGLRSAHFEEVTPPVPSESMKSEPPHADTSRASAVEPNQRRRRAALAVAGVGAAAILAFAAVSARKPGESNPPQSSTRTIALDLHREGSRLVLTWNPAEASLRNATHAKVHINEGKSQSNIDLSPTDLRAGELSYWPESGDVRFRMEVSSGNVTATESVRYLAESAMASTPPPTQAEEEHPRTQRVVHTVPERRAPGHETKREEKQAIATAERPKRNPGVSKVERPSGEAERAAPVEGSGVMKPPSDPPHPPPRKDQDPPPVSAVVKREAVRPEPAPTVAPRPVPMTPPQAAEPYVAVTAEPVTESIFSRALKKIPLLGRLKKSKPPVTGPVPLDQPKPRLSAADRGSVTQVESVDVRVYVSETGNVEFAEPNGSSDHPGLAAAAVYAARKWRFAPAQLGSEKVPSEAILHFVFVPPSQQSR